MEVYKLKGKNKLMMEELKSIKKAANFIKNKTKVRKYDIAVIFGSGLSPDANDLQGIHILYNTIPGFPVSSVPGHFGRLVSFSIDSKKIIFFLGRVHMYEGFTPKNVVFPVRVIKELGVSKLIITNSSGALNTKFKSGDLMIINDHINLTGANPLVGANIKEHGPRFLDMSSSYSIRLSGIAKKISSRKLKTGVYAGVIGPNYETNAEIKYLRSIGADAVGMSTVLEVIAANHCGIETMGISCITNVSGEKTGNKISHEDVLAAAGRSKNSLITLINSLLKEV